MKMAEKIKVSKEGIEIAYRRFLSDSGAGFIILLILILAYYYPVLGIPLKNTHLSEMFYPLPPELIIFICILLFVLASPLGLATNALSYFIFYSLTLRLEEYCYDSNSLFIKPTKEIYHFEELKSFFRLKKDQWYENAFEIEMVMETHHPELMEPISWLKGTHIFFRNVAILSLPLFLGSLYISSAKLLSSSASIISIIGILLMLASLSTFLFLLLKSKIELCIILATFIPIIVSLFIAIFKLQYWMFMPFLYSAMFGLMFCLNVLTAFFYSCVVLSRAYMLNGGGLTKGIKYLAKYVE